MERVIDHKILTIAENNTQPPSIYNLDEFIGSKFSKSLQRKMKFLSGSKPQIHPKEAKEMAMLLWEGDPLCNQAFLSILEKGWNPRTIADTLINKGIDGLDQSTEALNALWAQISEEPEWLDWKKLEKGAEIYRMYGTEAFQLQGIVSIDTFRNDNISAPLAFTGEYAGDGWKRYLHTNKHCLEVSEKGGMRAFKEGWKLSIKVRFLHTMIRYAILQQNQWDTERLGMPINSVGMVGAPLINSLLLTTTMRIFGYTTTEEDVCAVLHLWRYVHYIMGGNDAFFPTNTKEGYQTVYTITGISPLSDHPDGIKLGQSHLDAFKTSKKMNKAQQKERQKEYEINAAYASLLILPQTKKLLQMPNTTLPLIKYMATNFLKNKRVTTKRQKSSTYAKQWDMKVTKQRRDWFNRNDIKYSYNPKKGTH